MTEVGERSGEQLELVQQARARVRAARPKAVDPLAEVDPVAQVVVDVSLPHLDRTFDYAVPATMSGAARPGSRVRVRFSGRLVDGYVLARTSHTDHVGALARLARATSPEPVLTPEVAALGREVADHYGGVLADVLRLAVPPRHAATEAEALARAAAPAERAGARSVGRLPAGPAFLRAIAAGKAPAAVWTALPGPTWPTAVADRRAGCPRRRSRGPRRRRRRTRRGPGVGCSHRGLRARTARRAHCRPRAGRALPPLPRGQPRRGPVRRRHPGGPVRPRPRPRARRGLGRRGRPARRAPRALPARARGPPAACRRRGLRPCSSEGMP